jgi:hypothetical protein
LNIAKFDSLMRAPYLALGRVDATRFAAAMALPASSSGLFRFISPRRRPQSTDIAAAATWGVFAGTAAIYLVQPFDWIKKTFFEKPEPEA